MKKFTSHQLDLYTTRNDRRKYLKFDANSDDHAVMLSKARKEVDPNLDNPFSISIARKSLKGTILSPTTKEIKDL